MRAALALTLAAPLAFWACGSSPSSAPSDAASGSPDAEASVDATSGAPDAGAGGLDATSSGGLDASAEDAGSAPDASAPDAGDAPDAGPAPCTYPAAVEPMQLGQALYPYAWSDAVDPSGAHRSLALADAYCNADVAVDWSAFEHLLFVSMPAW